MLDTRPAPFKGCWKLPDGQYLLQGAADSWPTSMVSGIGLPNGELIQLPTPYYVVMAEGQAPATYPTPGAYSLEDVLYIYDFYAVTDGQLCQFIWQQQWSYDERVETRAVILTRLVECTLGELPFNAASLLTN